MEEGLPLIEIAAEDDSLIEQSPSAADKSASNCLFACSPFQIPPSRPRSSHPSPTMSLKNKGDVAKPTRSCATGKNNKENININKSELPKLSVEPQQMKRRKKGSAYNLQKSLAWDKAFSTDEGFLDALELSMLGGSNGNCGKELLPSIGESGRKFSGNSCGRVDSSDFPGTPKVLSNQKGCRSTLKSGCPRPLAFSSSANSSILKAGSKESKLIKLPGSRMGAQSHDNSTKSNLPSTSQTKHNQIGGEDIMKVTNSQSSSKTTRTISSKHKSGSHSVSLSENPPVQHPKRNKVEENLDGKLISERNLLPQQPSLAGRVNSRLEALTAALPPTGSHATAAHKVITKHGVLSEKVTVAATIPHTDVQSKKPSGLRMPSPSLCFFSQPKYPSSNCLSRGPTPPINVPRSCVPNSQKLNTLNVQYDSRLPYVPGKLLKKVENNLCGRNAEISESSSVSMTIRLEKNSVLTKEEQVSSYSKSSEVTKDHVAVERMTFCDTGFPEREISGKADQTSIEKQMDLQKNNNHRFMEDESSDQLKQDDNNVMVDSSDSRGTTTSHLEAFNIVSKQSGEVLVQDDHETNVINCHHAEESQCNSSTVPYETIYNSKPENAEEVIKQDSVLMMHEDYFKTTHDTDLWKIEKAEVPITFSEEDHDLTLINPVCNDRVFLEDDTLEALKYKRESFPKNDSMLRESKRNESLDSNDHFLLEDKSFQSLTYKRENFASSDPIFYESKRVETLGSSAPLHTNAGQAYEDVSGSYQLRDKCSMADDGSCSLLSQTVAAAKCDGVNCLDTRLNVVSELNQYDIISENRGVNQDDHAVVSNIIEQLQVDASLSNAEQMICIQDGDRFIDSHARLDRSTKTHINYEPVKLCSVKTEEDAGANTVENQILTENKKINVLDRKILLDYQTGDLVKTPHLSLTYPGSARNCETVSLPLCMLEDDKCRMNNVDIALCKDDKEQSSNGSNSRLIDSAVNILSSVVFADTNIESGQPPEVQVPTLVTDHIFYGNHDTGLDDCTSLSEDTGGENQEEKCLPTALNQVYFPKDGSNVYLEGTYEKQFMHDEPTASISTKASIENDNHSPDTLFKSEVVLSGLATCTESDLASAIRGGQTSGSMNTGQSCSGESVNAVETGVAKINSISPADIELNNCQMENLVIEYQHGRDNANYPTEDAKTMLSIKTPGDAGIAGNLSIKPPPNAAPFSEEWLAAMEAAGEEILTMKSGAVQNSPTDKALPEPNPWSPVKRKQNQLGPFDCTKFINVAPGSD